MRWLITSHLIWINTVCHSVIDFWLKSLFATMTVSKFRERRVHCRNLGRKCLRCPSFVCLSLLTMTKPNQLCDVLLFVCYLCVLRWLTRPILALNCLLQIEQERSEEESSVGDALALAFPCAHFCSASQIPFASYSPAPFLIRPRHFVRSCAICSHDSVGMLKSLREALRVSLYRFFWPPWVRFPSCSSP